MLTAVGVAFEIFGLVVTGAGAWRTWKEFAPPGEGFLDPVVVPTRVRWRRVSAAATRAYRRIAGKPSPRVVGAGVIVQGGGAFNARGRIQFRTLPMDGNPEDGLKELDERTRQLMTMASDTKELVEDGLAAARDEMAAVAGRIDEIADAFDRQTRRIAVGGIRLQALGLTLIALGLMLQGLGAVG